MPYLILGGFIAVLGGVVIVYGIYKGKNVKAGVDNRFFKLFFEASDK
jgi:hypothetical protein